MACTSNVKTYLAISLVLLGTISTVTGKSIYVDADATGANNGSSWADAYNFLQDALADANSSPKPVEIRVAQGAYTPDSNSMYPDGTGDRTAAFQLINGITLKGSYAGFGELNPNARDVELYETVLSGDLDGNDIHVNNPAQLLYEPTRAENSYNIVVGAFVEGMAWLDGFTISGAVEAGNSGEGTTGLLLISGHYIHWPSGICPTIKYLVTNCKFIDNAAHSLFGQGGGAFISGVNAILTDCIFHRNFAGGGGGLCSRSFLAPPWLESPETIVTLVNCTFSENSAGTGGGVYNAHTIAPSLWLEGRHAQVSLINCLFTLNFARYSGGGMYSVVADVNVVNCTFGENSAEYHGGIYANSTTTVKNCILWGNEGGQIGGDGNVTYSDVQDSWSGEGNIDEDPCFVDPNNGDYHLLRTSPCIDAANDANVYTDIEGNIRPFDFPGVDNNGELPDFDMGAYEATAEQAKLMILPRVINRSSRQKRILAWLRLPEGITRDQIDSDIPVVLYPGDIEAIRQYVFQQRRRRPPRTSIFASFDKAELMDAVGDNGRVELQVLGQFVNPGRYFYGTDTVWINSRGWRPRGHR